MDTDGDDTLGRFYADVLGLDFVAAEDVVGGVEDVEGGVEGKGIAMCKVPEPKSVKHRVHLDLYTGSVESLVDRGATVVLPAEESGLGWTLMSDPEGGEFCAFLRAPAELPDYRLHGLVVDSAQPQEIARWWADVFGVGAEVDKGWCWLKDVPGMPPLSMDFVPVPEPKTAKNRIHWDLYADVADMRAAGATVLRARDDEIGWTVMADPEGNEFCVFAP